MKKILLFNSISLLVGIFIGHWYTQSSDTSLNAVALQNKNLSQLEEEKKQKAETIESVQPRKETSDMKNKNYKFFKQENNYKGNGKFQDICRLIFQEALFNSTSSLTFLGFKKT
jgi:hypothetical protein